MCTRYESSERYQDKRLTWYAQVDAPAADTGDQSDIRVQYRANDFVQDAFSVRITPFSLDTYANEWNDLRRVQNAHAIEVDNLRMNNRNLAARV